MVTSEKLDKAAELVDAVKNLTINDVGYYESDTATTWDAKGNITRNPETVTPTSNGNKPVTHTRNSNFEKILSNQTIHVVVPTMNPSIDQSIAPIGLAPQTP